MSTLPTGPGFAALTMRAIDPTLLDETRGGKVQVRKPSGQNHKWVIRVEWPPMTRAEFAAIEAFIASQGGRYGTFEIVVPDKATPRGVATGTPLVNGGSQTGNSLVTDGWTPNITNIMRAGDIIRLAGHNKVYMVTADANSNGTGQSTLSIYPALFASPANNAAITVDNTPITVRLADDIYEYPVSPPVLYSFAIDTVENY